MDNNKNTGLRSNSDIDIRVSPRQAIRYVLEFRRVGNNLGGAFSIAMQLEAELNHLQPPNFKTEIRPYWRRFEKKHTKK